MVKHYLVTGGAGFIGSHIAQALVARGDAVRVLDNFSTGREANLAAVRHEVELVRGDVRDAETVRAATDGVEVIFHEAAVASVQASIEDPVATLAINLAGTQHVLAAARHQGVRRVVFASSAAVYGDTPEMPKAERLPAAPRSPYAVHKLAGEQLCGIFTRLFGLETVALRYFNVFGPRQDPRSEYSGVISRFSAALTAGRRPVIYGDGEQTRDFVYIGDVVRANLLAAEAPTALGRSINIACGRRTALKVLVAIMGEWLGQVIEPEFREARPGDIHDSVADIQLAREVLAYEPQISLHEGLRLTLADIGISGEK